MGASPLDSSARWVVDSSTKVFMRIRLTAALVAASLFLAGCTTPPQRSLPLRSEALASKPKMGVAMSLLPKVDTAFPGAECLLCLAAASMANRSLTAHVQTLSGDDLKQVKDDLAERLRAKGLDVIVIEEPIDLTKLREVSPVQTNFARRDFSPLKEKHRIDKLVVIDISAWGVERTYSAYVPTSEPKAIVRGASYIVDLTSNALDWYMSIWVRKAAGPNWDEPPKFPGLTNAFYQAIEQGKDAVLQPFEQ